MHFLNERQMNGIDCQGNARLNSMFKNHIDSYFKRSGYVYMWAMSITGHSISQWLPCPVPSWVPNTIGTWGGTVAIQLNSVKKRYNIRSSIIIYSWQAPCAG